MDCGERGGCDVAELYRSFSKRLLRIVRGGVRAPDPVIEDACQFAWSRLVHQRSQIEPETVRSWLVSTAVHEALKLVRRAGSELPLETVTERGGQAASLRVYRGPQAVAEDHERLALLNALSERQQKVLWLYGLGLSYAEIARRQGCTTRAVERQLQRARAALHSREAAQLAPEL